MKKSLWGVLSAIVIFAAADLIILGWWLPDKLKNELKNGMNGGSLTFQDIQLSWNNGRLINGEWNSQNWNLFLGEGLFSYSSIDWLLGENSRTKHLELHDFRMVGINEMDRNSSILSFLKDFSYESINFGCDSIEMSGSIESSEFILPFSLFAKFSNVEKEMQGTMEIRLAESFPQIVQLFPEEKTLFLKFHLKDGTNSEDERFKASIVSENLGELNFLRKDSYESIGFKLKSESSIGTQINFSVNRKSEREKFAGDWNGSFPSQNLVGQFPIFSIINGKLNSSGEISFDSELEEIDIYGHAHFSASSLFFPREGLIFGQIEGSSRLKNQNWTFEKIRVLIENQNNEKVEANLSSPFSNFNEIEQILFQLNALDVSRLKNHFPQGSKLSGNLVGEISNDFLNLSSNNLLLQKDEENLGPVSASLISPIYSNLNLKRNLDFEFKTPPEFLIESSFLPANSSFFQQFKFSDFQIDGQINSSGWSVTAGEFKLYDNTQKEIFSFMVKDNFLLNFNGESTNWDSVKRKKKGVISVAGKDFIPELFFGHQNFRFTGQKRDLSGQIIFEGGKPCWIFEGVQTVGNLKNNNPKRVMEFIMQGDWRFYPSEGEHGLFTISDIETKIGMEEFFSGELSLFLNEKGEASRIVSKDLQVHSSLFRTFLFPLIGEFENFKLSVHRLDWKFDSKKELILDGFISGSDHTDSANSNFKIPLKWTFAKKNGQVSHWVQLAYHKKSRSDLEISFLPEKNLLSIVAEKINLMDLKNLVGTGSLSFFKDNIFDSSWLAKEKKINAKLYFKTVSLNSTVELSEFKADLNLHDNEVFFKADLQGSPIEGSININFSDQNSSEHFDFDLQLFGQDTNASVLNSVIKQDIRMNGAVDWKLRADGSVGGEYQLNIQLDIKEFSVDLLSQVENSHVEWLKRRMEESLGTSFSWSAPQTKMIEALGLLLRNLFFESGSVEIEKTKSGDWKFSQTNWRGPEMILLSRGTISPEGNLKVNLFPAVKNKWADFLEVVNVLAAGKLRKGYRTLKREPLVIEGDGIRLTLSNWWKMLGQGIGLEPNE